MSRRPCAVEGCKHPAAPGYGRCVGHSLAKWPECTSCGNPLAEVNGISLCDRCKEKAKWAVQ